MKLRIARLKLALSILSVFVIAFFATLFIKLWPELTRPKKLDPIFQFLSPLELASIPTATRFSARKRERCDVLQRATFHRESPPRDD
jgi:hypothetical protein